MIMHQYETPSIEMIPVTQEHIICASRAIANSKFTVEFEEPKKESITLIRSGDTFIFNKGKASQITLIGASESVAKQIQEILDGNDSIYDAEKIIRVIMMENKVDVEEINTFRSQVRPIVEKRIQKLISEDQEWESLGERDREDKRQEYIDLSMVKFDNEKVTPFVAGSLSELVLESPAEIPSLDEMIKHYGLTNIITYSEYIDRKKTIISIQDPKYRKPLEDLVNVGLAYNGKDMSIEELLSSLTLNELNEIADTTSRFSRKEKAIKYIAEKEDVSSIIEKHIALRSLFTLKPLQDQYQGFNFDVFRGLLRYYDNLAGVVISVVRGYSTISFY